MSRRRNNSSAGAQLLGALLLLGLVLLIIKWLLITAAILVVPFSIWWLWDRARRSNGDRHVQQHEQRRREVELLAAVDAAGGCGWCGSRAAHVGAHGQIVSPSDFHREEIDQAARPVDEPTSVPTPRPAPSSRSASSVDAPAGQPLTRVETVAAGRAVAAQPHARRRPLGSSTRGLRKPPS